ncbi:MAG: sensor histidine kinase [Flavobacteriaceae bacterium]|nr:sensor histidine kinase [Flavobacteriaceae bacterium]
MSRCCYFTLIFFLIGSLLFAQGLQENNESGIQQKNENAVTLIQLAKEYASNQKYNEALEVIEKGLSLYNNEDIKAEFFFQKALIYSAKDDIALQIKYLKEAGNLYNNFNDSMAAESKYLLQRVYQKAGFYAEALSTGFDELKFRKDFLGEDALYVRALQEIGYTYDRMSEYEKSIEWNRKSIPFAKKINHSSFIGRGYGLIGIAYDERAQYDSALFYNQKAIEYFKEANNKQFLEIWYSNIGNTYTKMNRLDEAEKYTRMSLDLTDPDRPSPVTITNLGKIFLEKGDFLQAEKVLDSALNLSLIRGDKRFLSEAYLRFYELRLKQNRYKEALEFYVKFKENEDELFSQSKAQHTNQMSIQFETEEKEKEILKQRAEIAENELQLQRRGLTVLALLALIFTSLILGYFFWKQQKVKNLQLLKENELKNALSLIETQNKLYLQRQRISRDLHDNIGAQLTFIISSIDNLKYIFMLDNQLYKKLNQISEFTSETISELRDTIWAMNSPKITFEDLKLRITNFIDKANLAATGTSFNFEVNETINIQREFDAIQGINVYRIIQEAVNNAIKHAQSTAIKVNFKVYNDKIQIVITDNGKGFNPNNEIEGNGILSMKKRAAELQTELFIESFPEKGTRIYFDLQ